MILYLLSKVMTSSPLVSVIVTTKNEVDVIAKLLISLKKQNYKNIEIILIDNNSSDDTLKIAKAVGVKVYQMGPERSAQRNLGAEKAKGKYLLFVDADMELSKGVVQECVNLLEDENNLVGAIIPEISQASNYWEKVKAFERSFYYLEGDEVTDAARFFKRVVFLEVGGYDETITGPEDWDLSESIKKTGYKFGRIQSIIFHKERIKSLLTLAKKKFYYGLKVHSYLQKQKVSPLSSKTIYFLRPVFYKHRKNFIVHPLLTLGMFIMFFVELISGGIGYLVGILKKT